MTSHVVLTLIDLAALIERGLRDRVRSVTCARQGPGFRVRLVGLDAHARLPRCDVALDLALTVDDGVLVVRFTVAPATWSAWILVPGQRLGGGRMIVEPLVDRLGLRPAVRDLRDDRLAVDVAHIPGLTQLGLHITAAAAIDAPEPGLRVEFSINRSA